MQMTEVHLYPAQTALDSAAHLKHLLPPGFYIQSFELTTPLILFCSHVLRNTIQNWEYDNNHWESSNTYLQKGTMM